MARKLPQPLTLPNAANLADIDDDPDFIGSPRSPLSPKSPISHFRFNSNKKTQSELPSMQAAESQQRITALSTSQTTPSLSAISGTEPQQHQQQKKERPARSGFFSNYKANRLQHSSNPSYDDRMSRDGRPSMPGRDSSKDHTRTGKTSPFSGSSDSRAGITDRSLLRTESSLDRSIARRAVGGPSNSDVSLDSNGDSTPNSAGTLKKNKPKAFSILSRSKSVRDEHSPRELSPTNQFEEGEKVQIQQPIQPQSQPQSLSQDNPAKATTPVPEQSDSRSFRSMMSSTVRQRSEDRQPSAPRDAPKLKESSKLREQSKPQMKDPRDNLGRSQPSFSGSFREGGGHTFLNNLKSSATKGAGALSKGLFGKSGRSGSTNEKEPVVDDEHYQIKVLCLPLMEQTRLTRISKKLEDSRDKTEFWMPAFPWRAIDYLNYKGSDVEGLYRVPGSGPQIKKWQRRFDEEYDIDLFEQDDLYDINIIGSMLKAWLRELPDELFPKASQDRVAREAGGQEEVPQLLIDELSNLSPFNYYLLFAITCHLSLLLAHSKKNKMDFRNLCICFQPCMKIDAYCFKFLVCNWRECWKGCKTEQYYVEQEYMLFDMVVPSSAEGRSSTAVESHDERNVSSSDSSKPSSVSIDQAGKNVPSQNKKLQSQANSVGTVNTTLTVVQERTPPGRSNDMRPLSPIKPLSPIGF
ncbi:related to GTPase-activating protein beta-chimerin [Rhynchosporium secalis]|uniref:Related to GTPase-activating protein beta-chimerin n=1 Tax=Rhynchosporium secalis TaxID=38038 RepID=A0A1E1MLB8_RHYSE|nr:related to GTPase-activating protein beta-chimerin [Rhynchosporium secalis]